MVKKHSSEAFYAFDDPLEAAVFSVLVEMMKELERGELQSGGINLEAKNISSAHHFEIVSVTMCAAPPHLP